MSDLYPVLLFISNQIIELDYFEALHANDRSNTDTHWHELLPRYFLNLVNLSKGRAAEGIQPVFPAHLLSAAVWETWEDFPRFCL